MKLHIHIIQFFIFIFLCTSLTSNAFAQDENTNSASNSEFVEDAQCVKYIFHDSDTRQAQSTSDGWVDKLIASGANVNCRIYLEISADDQDGERFINDGDEELEVRKDKKLIISPLFLARNREEFEKLLKAGADVNAVDSNGQNVLFYIKDADILDLFIQYQIDIHHKDNAEQTALNMLIPEMLKNTFSWTEDGVLSGDDFNDEEGSGYTKDFASHFQYAKALIKAGAAVNGGEAKSQALLAMEPEKFMKEIIKSGLKINARDVNGYTPLHKLVIHKVSDMMPRGRGGFGGGRHRVVNTELYDPIHVLLKAGADPNIKDDHGRTPLFYAQNPNVVKDLIKSKAKLNIQDEDGRTPLHYAVLYNRTALEPILKASPNIHIKDHQGKKAADLTDDEEVVYQIKHGGRLPRTDDDFDEFMSSKPVKVKGKPIKSSKPIKGGKPAASRQ